MKPIHRTLKNMLGLTLLLALSPAGCKSKKSKLRAPTKPAGITKIPKDLQGNFNLPKSLKDLTADIQEASRRTLEEAQGLMTEAEQRGQKQVEEALKRVSGIAKTFALADKEQLEKALANEKAIKALKGEIEELQVAQQEELAAQKEETQAAIDSAVATESSRRKVMGVTLGWGSVLLVVGTVGTAYLATRLYQDIQAMKGGSGNTGRNSPSVSSEVDVPPKDVPQKKGVLNNIKGAYQNAKNKLNDSPKLRAGLRALGTIGAFSAAVTGVSMIATSGAGLSSESRLSPAQALVQRYTRELAKFEKELFDYYERKGLLLSL